MEEARDEKVRNDSLISKRFIYGVFVFSLIALVFSVFGLISARRIIDVERKVDFLEYDLNYSKKKLAILLALERIYTLTMIDRNYADARKELEVLKSNYKGIMENLNDSDRKKIEIAIKELDDELNRGPSPIPELVSSIREVLTRAESAKANSRNK